MNISKVEAFAHGFSQSALLRPKQEFDNFKNNLLYCFKMGAYKVHLYEDGRKKDFLTIRREDFSESEIVEGFIKIDTKRKIEALEKRKINIQSAISFNEKILSELQEEISKLQSL